MWFDPELAQHLLTRNVKKGECGMRAMTDGKQGGLAQTFTPRVVDMIVAEIVDSYRKQLEPPSKAVQWGKRLTYRQPDSADISV